MQPKQFSEFDNVRHIIFQFFKIVFILFAILFQEIHKLNFFLCSTFLHWKRFIVAFLIRSNKHSHQSTHRFPFSIKITFYFKQETKFIFKHKTFMRYNFALFINELSQLIHIIQCFNKFFVLSNLSFLKVNLRTNLIRKLMV